MIYARVLSFVPIHDAALPLFRLCRPVRAMVKRTVTGPLRGGAALVMLALSASFRANASVVAEAVPLGRLTEDAAFVSPLVNPCVPVGLTARFAKFTVAHFVALSIKSLSPYHAITGQHANANRMPRRVA
jgi:hypothetical protein